MNSIQTIFLDFDGVIVHYMSFFEQFFRIKKGNRYLGHSIEYDSSIKLFFEYCEKHNIAIFITSLSSQDVILPTLEAIGIYQWYTKDISVFGYRNIGYDKTNLDFWGTCIDRIGIKKESVLVIDDSQECILSAKSVNLLTCYYSHFSSGEKNPNTLSDYHAESFSDIIKVLSDNPSCNTSVSL